MKKTFLLGAALVGLMTGPAHAIMPARVLPPGNVSFIAAPDSMPAEAWKPGDDVKLAQVGFGGLMPGPGTVHSAGGGGGYTGPSDARTQTWFYGAVAASAAARGTAALEICDGGSCVTVNSDASTGIVPNPSPDGSNPCNVTTHYCDVRTLKEQLASGIGDAVQTTALNRAKWRPPGQCPTTFSASVGCLFFGANTVYKSANNWTTTLPWGMTAAFNRDTGHATDVNLISADGGGVTFAGGFFGAVNDVLCYTGSGSLDQSATDGVWHAGSCQIVSGGSDTMKVDNNAVVTGDGGDGNFGSVKVVIGTDGGGNRPWYGYMMGVSGSLGTTTNAEHAAINTAYKTIGGF